MLLRAVGMWLLFALLAVLNGGLRDVVLASLLGAKLALSLSAILLSILIFLLTFLALPLLKIPTLARSWTVGILWLCLTVALEFLGGRYLFGRSWEELLRAYDLSTGNLWLLVLTITLLSPYLAARIRGVAAGNDGHS